MLIMTFATKPLSYVSTGATRVVATGIAGVVALTKAIINRRDILRLTELDERSLKDIGLVRSDVEGALATSWLNDPSTVLASRSGTSAGVASARRDEGIRQSHVSPARPQARPAAPAKQEVACCA